MTGATIFPRDNIQIIPAGLIQAINNRRDVLVGQRPLGIGSETEGLVSNVHLMSDDQIKAIIGLGELYYRVKDWRAGNNNSSPLDVLYITEAGISIPAEVEIEVISSVGATTDGSFTISLIDETVFTVTVPIITGDTKEEITTNIQDALDSLVDKIFVTSLPATNKVLIKASEGGTGGNYYGIQITGSAGGILITDNKWDSGDNDPLLADIIAALDLLEGTRYTGLEWPENWYNNGDGVVLDLAADFMFNRWNDTSNGIMDGIVFTGSSENLTSVSPPGQKEKAESYNNQNLVFYGNDKEEEPWPHLDWGPTILKPADWVMSYMLGVRSKRLTPGANIANDVTTIRGAKDQYGGAHLASLPYANTPLRSTPITVPVGLFSPVEQAELKASGFSTYGVNPANTEMISGEIVTTYKTNAIGAVDLSFKYLNYVDTASIIRETYYNVFQSLYAQTRLVEGDVVAGTSTVNSAIIEGDCKNIYKFLEEKTLVEKGLEAEKFFSENLEVTINKAEGLVTIFAQIPIVTQLRQINFTMQLAFEIDGNLLIG